MSKIWQKNYMCSLSQPSGTCKFSGVKLKRFYQCKKEKTKRQTLPQNVLNVTLDFVFFTDKSLLCHMASKLSSTHATLIQTSDFLNFLPIILILLFIRERVHPRAKTLHPIG